MPEWWEEDKSLEDAFCKKVMKFRPTEDAETSEHFRASGLQKLCPRAAYFNHFEPRPPKFGKPAIFSMFFGTTIHEFLQNRVLGPMGILEGFWERDSERRWGLMPEGPGWSFVESELVDENTHIGGHPDGIVVGSRLLEIKVTNNFYYQSEKFLESYKWQANIYMKLTGMKQTLFLIVNLDETVKKRRLVCRAVVYDYDEGVWEQARQKALVILKAIDAEEIPKGSCADLESGRAKKCPFRKECLKVFAGKMKMFPEKVAERENV